MAARFLFMKNYILFIILSCMSAFTSKAAHIVLSDSLIGSKAYPATVHHFQISVPDSYTGSEPAALYLGLDGILCDAPAVIDSLMRSGDMPLAIGVYLQPGVVADSEGTVLRYNRSNEFDATDSRFADFLASELFPYISTLSTPDGRPIRLSDDPEKRCIFGLSSGGIAAFTAAWHRPDLFGKVFSGCGTFVPMRGGNELQAIVRKHESKPLRIFLQDGYEDTWNPLFGSWYEANRMLASALEFAGYDCAFDWAEGGHSVRRATEIFPNVMRWIWRTDSAVAPTSNNFLRPLLESSGDWQLLHSVPDNVVFSESYAVYPDSTLCVLTEPSTNYLTQCLLGKEGNKYACQRFYWLHSYDNSDAGVSSMAFDSVGNLWVVTKAGIQICDQNGRVRGILSVPRDACNSKLSISDGIVYLQTHDGRYYSRKLNVVPARPGIRPSSQGQG